MRQLVAAAQGAQHVAGFQTGAGTGRAAGHRQALDAHDERLALDEVETHVQVVRHAMLQIAVDEHLIDFLQAVQQALLQAGCMLMVLLHLFLGQAEGLAHAHALVGGQRAAAHAALVAATVHLRLDAHARLAAHVQGTNALGTIGLVAGQTHQVDRHGLDVDFHLAGCLRSVHVEDDALLAAQCADGRNVLHHADLVVHEHHADQDGVGTDGRLQHVHVDQAVFLHIQIGHLEALALQLAHGVQHGLVLGLDGDEVLALALVEVRSALDRQVVGLGRAAGPDDLARVGADQVGHLFAGLLDGRFGFPAPGMAARGRVAEVLTDPGDHGFGHARVHRRGGAVIEVNRKMRSHCCTRCCRKCRPGEARIVFTWKAARCPGRRPSWAHSRALA